MKVYKEDLLAQNDIGKEENIFRKIESIYINSIRVSYIKAILIVGIDKETFKDGIADKIAVPDNVAGSRLGMYEMGFGTLVLANTFEMGTNFFGMLLVDVLDNAANDESIQMMNVSKKVYFSRREIVIKNILLVFSFRIYEKVQNKVIIGTVEDYLYPVYPYTDRICIEIFRRRINRVVSTVLLV